jgi:formate--tetrahydrofolate ligase
MLVAQDTAGRPVTAADLGAHGAMAALLRDAVRPNLVQTIEGGPALVHGGPFGNIAHGCSSVIASRCALGLADVVVTEAGFASDLGAEKFMHIVTPHLGQSPDAIVLVATVRALAHHGDGDLGRGLANLDRHIAHLKSYGPPVVVAVNRFVSDTQADLARVVEHAKAHGASAAVVADPWGSGGAGCEALADAVIKATETPSTFTRLYAEDAPIEEKIATIVTRVYGGTGAILEPAAKRKLAWLREHGHDRLPVCMAKTQSSLSDDPKAKNAPLDFVVRVRELRPSLGAGFVVAIAGDMMLMPGLGKTPAALKIDVDDEGRISGLF